MADYTILKKSRYFEVLGGLNAENRGDDKVAMLSELDMSAAEAVRSSLVESTGIKPSYTALVAKAVSLTLREQPHANRVPIGWLLWRRVVQLHRIDMTVAVERDQPGSEQAVFAGTIRNTDSMGLVELTRELQALAQATGENSDRWHTMKWIVEKLPAPLATLVLSMPGRSASLWVKHRGGAVMISSPAKYGVDIMVGAWPWPIGFSFGLVKERPIAADGKVLVRPTMTLTMSFDRRLMGGAPAARFFRAVCRHLEDARDL